MVRCASCAVNSKEFCDYIGWFGLFWFGSDRVVVFRSLVFLSSFFGTFFGSFFLSSVLSLVGWFVLSLVGSLVGWFSCRSVGLYALKMLFKFY